MVKTPKIDFDDPFEYAEDEYLRDVQTLHAIWVRNLFYLKVAAL